MSLSIPYGELEQKYEELREAVERVRELHTKEHYIVPGCSEPNCCGDTHEGYQCVGCCEDWPCDTIKALDGERHRTNGKKS